jgi:hypothetical protein
MFSSDGATSHRLKHFFKIAAAWLPAHGARRGTLQCRSRQAITLPEGNLRGVGDGAGFPDQDTHA